MLRASKPTPNQSNPPGGVRKKQEGGQRPSFLSPLTRSQEVWSLMRFILGGEFSNVRTRAPGFLSFIGLKEDKCLRIGGPCPAVSVMVMSD